MYKFLLLTFALMVVGARSCTELDIDFELVLEAPGGSRCSRGDSKKIAKGLETTLADLANEYLADHSLPGEFDTFTIEAERRLESEGMKTEQSVRDLQFGFVYRGGGQCSYCWGDNNDGRRRLVGNLRARKLSYSGMMEFINSEMKSGIATIMSHHPISKKCFDDSLGQWEGMMNVLKSTCYE